jgi:hypothetical protein
MRRRRKREGRLAWRMRRRRMREGGLAWSTGRRRMKRRRISEREDWTGQ